MNNDTTDQNVAARSTGFFRLPPTGWLAISGTDRKSFLHNFSTADIKALTDGNSCEAFILDGRGKTLWFGQVLALPDRLLLWGGIQTMAPLNEHLDRYIIREDVQLVNESDTMQGLFLTSANNSDLSGDLSAILDKSFLLDLLDGSPPPNLLQQNQVVALTAQINAARLEIAGWGYLIFGNRMSIDDLASRWQQFGFSEFSTAELERLRIESGTPWYGLDVDDRNLPQELNRDDKAISFTKGCYLGQETVARIDALGHVNQFLVRLGIEVDLSVETDGAPKRDDPLIDPAEPEKKIGRITSVISTRSARSIRSDSRSGSGAEAEDGQACFHSESPAYPLIGLGYVRQRYAEPGTRLQCGSGQVTVL